MKRFIITNLLAFITLPMLACMWIETHNYYLFSVYQWHDFQDRVYEVCNDNWKSYLGINKDSWYYFNADEVIEAAKKKNDQLMVSYVQNLQKYLDCARVEERKQHEWDYPTNEEVEACKKTLMSVRSYAFGKQKTRLRSQHGLLYMRCNMLLGYHQDNVGFWEQSASQYIESVYKDMMKNIYAGALYKTGKEEKAGELFAEMGDYNSLMTQYYKKRSYFAIQREYRMNPNAKVLPFLLQDFVNNAQEAFDATNPNSSIDNGKLFIRDLSADEVRQMINFCDQVIREGKTEIPALWKSAKAWLEYMFGNKQQALADIIEAGNMRGTERMIDNTRVLRIYMASALEPQSTDFDNWLEPELQWLHNKAFNNDVDWHYHNAYDRIAHQVLNDRFEKGGHPERALALMKSGNFSVYEEVIDTMQVESLLAYRKYLSSPAETALDRFLKSHVNNRKAYVGTDEDMRLIELVGTKYMRLCQWDKAIEWLKLVPVTYYNQCGWNTYAALRTKTVEPWIKRQWIKEEILYNDNKPQLKSNPKLAFAKDMLAMEGELNVLKGQAQQQRYYDLAVRYAQANFTGDCWYLMRDSKSENDTLRVNEVSLAGRALAYLRKASQAKDPALKEKALFAASYRGLYPEPQLWYEYVWNSETYEYNRKANPKTQQYRAFATLADFEKKSTAASQYVSRCDEYIQFRKHFQ